MGKTPEIIARMLPDGSIPAKETLHLPLFMPPAQSQLQFHYYYDYPKQGNCKDVLVDNVRGAIDPDSTIDISGLPHFIALPDLAAFANSGFPFTRMADLSETAVVLPTQPSAEDYSTYLTLMGRMGGSTGYPATAVKIASPTDIQSLAAYDLLVIGWADYLPVSLDRGEKRFTLTDAYSELMGWWNGADGNRNRKVEASLSINSSGTDVALVGFESPLASGRSVVAMTSGNQGGLQAVVDVLLDPERLPQVQGSLVLVRGTTITSLAAQQNYYVGRLNPWTYVQWWLSQRPYAMLLMLAVATPLLVQCSILFGT
ncbi:cellulose biosynthesis cyclic di-GMP-binding regulatory protein BcsB [Cupriavidus sp. AcVe19-1a]|uniref:cellulose biosynthesis cyclic di-GMP-binding regulatory protein BcsB n=1 Tax=Cupriavidus sp. AcVe19-1a TaxID=2821359 RepID=UPI001FD7DDE1|nr:cellulose biosynthesis cyclic di-GMP-binding regulatory protein BcsB [Cupriavidus sp. AcVe19-1a]